MRAGSCIRWARPMPRVSAASISETKRTPIRHMHMPAAGLLLLAAQASKAAAIEATPLFIGLRLRRSCNLVSAFGETPGEDVSQVEAAGPQVGCSEANGS